MSIWDDLSVVRKNPTLKMNINYKNKSMKRYIHAIISILMFLSGLVMIFFGIKNDVDRHKRVEIPGVIQSKSEVISNKNGLTCSEFFLTIEPNDTTYNDYIVNVDFTEFSSSNIGDEITHNIELGVVKDYSTWAGILVMLGIVLAGVAICYPTLFVLFKDERD